MSVNYNGLPEHIQGSMQRYIENRISPGSFCTAVLCNDMTGAFARADHINRYKLFEIVSWLYNEAPSPCWGSPEKVNAWLKNGRRNNHENS